MKKVLSIVLSFMALGALAQEKGRFEVYNFDNFKVHVYYTNDALGDASYIIEGETALVTLEDPLFKENVAEYGAYLKNLGKPVEQRIADYHLGGTGSYDFVMPEGMPDFTKGEVYGGMMKGFAQVFGDAIVALPTGKTTEVAFGTVQTYAGVPFRFTHGASTDFPGACILIGNKVCYTHWAPAKAHASYLYISSLEAIDAQIFALEESLQTGAELFIGGHGGAVKRDAVDFRIAYLKKMKELQSHNKTVEAFVKAMKEAFPALPGEEGLDDLAKTLYK